MANKKIIELDAASQVNSDAVFPLSQLVNSNQKTLKATVAQMQAAMLAPVSGLVTLGESSGSIASFSTDIADKLFSCYVNVTAVQAGSGTPAPDNVRAISGWSECSFGQSAGNIWDEEWEQGGFNNSGVKEANANGLRSKNYIRVEPNTSYYFKNGVTGNNYVLYYTSGKDFISQEYKPNTIFTTPSNCQFIMFWVWNTTANYGNNISINYPSTDTAYHKTSHTNITFNTTVYGGVLDVLSGVLTVTHSIKTFNGSEQTWQRTSAGVFISPDNSMSDYVVDNLICNEFDYKGVVTATSDATSDLSIYFNNHADAGKRLFIRYNAKTTLTEFTNYLSSNNLVVLGKLATPTVIQLTPTEVKTLLGQNNIFGDCGDIDLKYLETIGNRL